MIISLSFSQQFSFPHLSYHCLFYVKHLKYLDTLSCLTLGVVFFHNWNESPWEDKGDLHLVLMLPVFISMQTWQWCQQLHKRGIWPVCIRWQSFRMKVDQILESWQAQNQGFQNRGQNLVLLLIMMLLWKNLFPKMWELKEVELSAFTKGHRVQA